MAAPTQGKTPNADRADARVKALEVHVERLHAALEQTGMNSKGTTDIFGRPFSLPVDDQHKATVFNAATLWSCANPHMRGFWAGTIGFFSTFFSTFAAAPLMAYIKKEGSLNLKKSDIVNSGIASVIGTIAMRLTCGWLCEKFGARKAFVFLLLLGVPGIIGIAFTTEATGFIICRFIIGLSLATFVSCQVWASQLFNKSVVGVANATAGGWGNLGGGITNLLMPYIMLGFLGATGDNEDLSWRLCYIVPLVMHIGAALYIMTGRDLPDGNNAELETSGAKQKTDSMVAVKTGASNINAWILTITYGFCFGVELTMTNVAALYFYTDHGLSPARAGVYAATFGLMNIFARSLGGLLSDECNKRFGVRGRLWAMFVIQVIEGFFCLVLGWVTIAKSAPNASAPSAIAEFVYEGGVYNLCPDHKHYNIRSCGTAEYATGGITQICQWGTNETLLTFTDFDLGARMMVGDMGNGDCIRNAGLAGPVVLIMIIFSTCVQMAEGLHFGVVPYISRPALGIVSGMVGAGGNAGAVLTLWSIFKHPNVPRTDQGYMILGAVVMVTAFLMMGIYLPEHGGCLFKKGSLSYDPQRWKPPADYRGADAMDYSNVNLEGGKEPAKKASATPDVQVA